MRLEITRLRQRDILSTRILNALASNRQVPQILERLANKKDLEEIARDIESNTTTQHSKDLGVMANGLTLQVGYDMPTLLSTTTNQVFESSDARKTSYQTTTTNQVLESSDLGGTSYQTSGLPDQPLLRHLLSLYRVWIHPQYQLFSMPDFLKDYETGGAAQCSSFLVAAICAAASHFLNPHWDPGSGTATDVVRLRQSLIAQAEMQEGLAEPKAETTAHALAVMLIVNSHSVQRYNIDHVPAEYQGFPLGSTGGSLPPFTGAYPVSNNATYTDFPTTRYSI